MNEKVLQNTSRESPTQLRIASQEHFQTETSI